MATHPDWDPTIEQDVPARYAQMADQRARCPMARAGRHGGQWDVLRYADVVEAAGDAERFSNGLQSRYAKPMPPLEYDPPEHRDYRRMLAVFFTPKRMAMLEPIVRQNARDLLAPMVAAGRGDLAQGYSYPLPALGLCALLNIDGNSWGEIKEWSEHTLLKDSDNLDEQAIADAGHERIIEYAHTMIADRRANPRHPEEDIAAALLAARVGGEAMDDDTIARTLRILISAGHNSTTSAIGNMILHLAENPEDQALLRSDLSRIPAAAEEILRADTPVQEMPRVATRDTTLGGCPVKAGDRLGMFWAAANRDPEAFPEPDRIILDRKPNRHVAFGHGIHTCLGAPMARMEMRVAIEELFALTSHFALEAPAKRARFHRMGVVNLPLVLESAK